MFRDFRKNYRDFFQAEQSALSEFLIQAKVDSDVINGILDSGYYLQGDYVLEGFYYHSGAISKDRFVDIIKRSENGQLKEEIPTYKIRSITDALDILSTNAYYSRFEDYISFRGQNREFTTKRSFPHPIFSNKDGLERLIVPGRWRPYFSEGVDPNSRPMSTGLTPLSPEHFLADKLYYYGIDVADLKQKTLNDMVSMAQEM